MRVAFATADGVHVNEHFGWCRRFDIYEVSPAGFCILESRRLPEAGDDEDDRVRRRLEAIGDCAIVGVASIGPTAAARVVSARIHLIKVRETEEIAALLGRLRRVLGGTPPPWLRKHLGGVDEGTKRAAAGAPESATTGCRR